jgi:diguanylate cyclase (GGDEF)-like protein
MKITTRTIIVFALSLILCFSISLFIILNQILIERLTMEKTIAERTAIIDYTRFDDLSVRSWHQIPETWALIFISISISILIAIVAQSNSDLKKLKDKLEMLSNTDSLTGIHNRRYFLESAIPVINRDVRLKNDSFIMVLDIDYFKKINDTYGHAAGDTVLMEIASRIAYILRSYDLFARYGGEEFIMLVSDIDEDGVIYLAERIRRNISEKPINIEKRSLTITASLGLSQLSPINDLNTAIELADKALYEAKENGRNQVIINKSKERDDNSQ